MNNLLSFSSPFLFKSRLVFLLLSLSIRLSHPADLRLKQHGRSCADTASNILGFLRPTQFLRAGVKVTVRIFPLPAGVKWLSCPTERCRLQFYRGPFISRLMVWMAYEILSPAWHRSFPSRLLLCEETDLRLCAERITLDSILAAKHNAFVLKWRERPTKTKSNIIWPLQTITMSHDFLTFIKQMYDCLEISLAA